MRARAPGKVVLSGAYAVLAGAPAIVVAVDRYVVADGNRAAERTTAEVAAAVRRGDLPRAPWFDATALRVADEGNPSGDRKLGLGSSAAIVVASLAASLLSRGGAVAELAAAVFPRALAAHREAQPGGSGVDVAASAYGGVVCCRLSQDDGSLQVVHHSLPSDLVVEVFSADVAASTPELLTQVVEMQQRAPQRYESLIAAASEGAEQTAVAAKASDWIAGARAQYQALSALGRAAGASIVTPAMSELAELAQADSAAFGPAGAGGGDVAIHAAPRQSSPRFRARAREVGLCLLPLSLGAEGVHAVVDEDGSTS